MCLCLNLILILPLLHATPCPGRYSSLKQTPPMLGVDLPAR